MTQQGLGGVKTRTQGPGRLVQDISFFQAELRTKISMLQAELGVLAAEQASIERENANYSVFEHKSQVLAEELVALQDTLGDYNTLLDKLHREEEVEGIERQTEIIRTRNLRDAQLLDTLFAERQRKEQELRELERSIAEEQGKAEVAIAQLEEVRQTLYAQLKRTNAEMLVAAGEKTRELEGLQQQASALETELARDPNKRQAANLLMELSELAAQKLDLENMQRRVNGGEDKTKLMIHIKEDTLETQMLERQASELQAEAKRLEDSLAISEQEGSTGEKAAKFRELLKKDKEMSEFLAEYASKRQEALALQGSMEQSILTIIDRMKALNAAKESKTTASPESLKELKGSLKVKEKEMNNSQATQLALEEEYAKRLADMEKIQGLQVKLDAEVVELTANRTRLLEGIDKMDHLEAYEDKARQLKERYNDEIEQLRARKLEAGVALAEATRTYEAKRAELERNDLHVQLVALEQRLKLHEANNFQYREAIAVRRAETEYGPLRDQVLGLVEEVSEGLVRALVQAPGLPGRAVAKG